MCEHLHWNLIYLFSTCQWGKHLLTVNKDIYQPAFSNYSFGLIIEIYLSSTNLILAFLINIYK